MSNLDLQKWSDAGQVDYIVRESPYVVLIVAVALLLFWLFSAHLLQGVLQKRNALVWVWLGIGTVLAIRMARNGFTRNLWPTVFANNDGLFLLYDSRDLRYLRVPWLYIESIAKGRYSVNQRGLDVVLKPAEYDLEDSILLKGMPCVVVDETVTIKVPTGLRYRANIVKKLLSLKARYS